MPFHRRQAGALQRRSLPSFLLAIPSLCESAFSSLPFPPFTDARSAGSSEGCSLYKPYESFISQTRCADRADKSMNEWVFCMKCKGLIIGKIPPSKIEIIT